MRYFRNTTMKIKILTLLLIGVFCFSLTTCESGSVQSILENTDAQGISEEAEDEYHPIVPDAVINISEEDDKALTGTLTEDSYTNPYFGLKFNKPANGTIKSIMDDGTDIMPFARTYTDGIGGMHINILSNDGSVSATIQASPQDRLGKSEEEIIRERIELEKSLNESMENDSGITMENILIVGVKHPAYCETYSDEDGARKNIYVCILKGDFECDISISAAPEKFDEMAGLIEKCN